MQIVIVCMLVSGCCCYAAWKLMPSSWRRRLAGALLKLPLPGALNELFRNAATLSSGCGCDGCDHAPKVAQAGSVAPPTPATAPTAQPITFHPRMRH